MKPNRVHKMIDGIDHKQCSICQEFYPSTSEYFYKNKNAFDGVSPYCKKCEINKNKKYTYGEYYEKHKEVVKNRQRGLVEEYRENAKRQRLRGGQKEWRQNNPDKVIASNKKYSHKKHKITQKEWDACRLYFNYRCAYCNKTWEQNQQESGKDMHREHVYHDGSDKLNNCVPSCMSCNVKKHNFEFDEWYSEGNPIYNVIRKNRILKWIENDYINYIVIKES